MLGIGMMSEYTLGDTCSVCNDHKAATVKILWEYHKDDSGGRREHVFTANGTIAFQISFDTLVFSLQADCHANIALFAMKIILSKAFSNSTYATVVAMVNILSWVVIP